MSVTVCEEKLLLPTYSEPDAEALPMFAENRVHQRSSGQPYPNKIVLTVNRQKPEDKEYIAIRLENEHLRLFILPEIGGRIYAAEDKSTGYNFFYKQHVIKPALIGALGSWVSGGVEFNWPYHHRPSGFMPVDYEIVHEPDGAVVVWLSEHDPIDRMKGMVGVRLRPGEMIFETQMKLCNRTPLSHSFLWWENAAVPVNEDYQIFFPPDVEYVHFHYKKSVASYPIAGDCVYNGIHMKEWRDISRHKNTRWPTSYFSGPSQYDFFGGYDHGKECGVVHVADHHFSPGKKLFTWAYSQLARSWETALTDTDGQYAELMAGSYSDNQPDFAWLEPYETKVFSQYWYPISRIGAPHFANTNGALHIDHEKEKTIIKLQFTKPLSGAEILVLNGTEALMRQRIDPAAGELLSFCCPETDTTLTITVTDTDGSRVLHYSERKQNTGPLPEPRQELPLAAEMTSVQELYLAGVHVAQYRDPAVLPDAYWKTALERDPYHVSSLIAMAEFTYSRLFMNEAQDYIERAIRVLTKYNAHPQSGEAFYMKGLILEVLGKPEDARNFYFQAAWSGSTYAKAMTRIAALDLTMGEYEQARDHALEAFHRDTYHPFAGIYLSIAYQKLGNGVRADELLQSILEKDPLNHLAHWTAGQRNDAFYSKISGNAAQTCLDLAFDLDSAGQQQEAISLLEGLCQYNEGQAVAVIYYTLWHLHRRINSMAAEVWFSRACAAPTGNTFPFRTQEAKILEEAMLAYPENNRAAELLACLLYNKGHWQEAAALWEQSVSKQSDSYEPYRNLAVACYSHLNRKNDVLSLLRRAIKLKPYDEQLILEAVYVMGRMGVSPSERLEFLHEHASQPSRDDLFLEIIRALNQNGQSLDALALLNSRHFVPCEGGEHAVADQYINSCRQIGWNKLMEHCYDDAVKWFCQAQCLPDSLGAGIWNQVKLVPVRFLEAVARERLGEMLPAQEIYRDIIDISVEYFSKMHLESLPFYQAMSFVRLGNPLKAQQLMSKYGVLWKESMDKPDNGYFSTTPFFLSYCDDAKTMRRGYYGALFALSLFFTGNFKDAEQTFRQSIHDDPSLDFSAFYLSQCSIKENGSAAGYDFWKALCGW